MRRLLDGERFTHEGRFYTMRDALCEPRPVQAHLPILVGGSGPKKTLRTVAATPTPGTPRARSTRSGPRLDILDEHCAAVGRDRSDDRADGQLPDHDPRHGRRGRGRAAPELFADNGVADMDADPILLGSAGARRRGDRARTATSASRRSSSGCRRHSTARRSSGSARSPPCSMADARGSSSSPAASAAPSSPRASRPSSATG